MDRSMHAWMHACMRACIHIGICNATFQAIREVKDFGKKKEKLIVNNDQGERIMDDVEAAEYVRTYFVYVGM
jgi:hypothetical protein